MAHLNLVECLEPGAGKLERVHYFPRQLLTADDLTADSEYFRTKMRRHNRLLHGWGTVCGLAVSPAPTPELPWRVSIGDGYALGPYGDDIYVAEPVFLDLARCGPGTVTDPCSPSQLRTPGSAIGGTIFVAIQYAECLARPVRAMPAGCACEEEACEYSRIRDSFQIECLTELPPSHQPPPGPSLCDLIAGKQLPLCPPCPAEPWVVLAQVTLPASPTENIAENQIDNFTFRRQVFSTGMLQEQLIKCCCEPEVTQPAQVISIDPPNGSEFFVIEGQPLPPNFPSSILIGFNKSLQGATVNANTIQVTVSDGGGPTEPVPGEVTYDDTTRTARFTPRQPFKLTVQGNRHLVSVRGDGLNPIVDVDDLVLDGDADGSPGGSFISQFTVFFVVG
ncbi:MAG: Ig-like domain-containing protein [Gammaproteobacteria bacterium]